MKKIFTLVLALGSLSAVFAQGGRHDQKQEARTIVLSKPDAVKIYNMNDRNDYSFTAKERDQQIKQINKDFDKQIMSVKKNRSLRSFEKDRQIKMLDMQRSKKIKEVNDRFTSQHNSQYGNHNGRKW